MAERETRRGATRPGSASSFEASRRRCCRRHRKLPRAPLPNGRSLLIPPTAPVRRSRSVRAPPTSTCSSLRTRSSAERISRTARCTWPASSRPTPLSRNGAPLSPAMSKQPARPSTGFCRRATNATLRARPCAPASGIFRAGPPTRSHASSRCRRRWAMPDTSMPGRWSGWSRTERSKRCPSSAA